MGFLDPLQFARSAAKHDGPTVKLLDSQCFDDRLRRFRKFDLVGEIHDFLVIEEYAYDFIMHVFLVQRQRHSSLSLPTLCEMHSHRVRSEFRKDGRHCRIRKHKRFDDAKVG